MAPPLSMSTHPAFDMEDEVDWDDDDLDAAVPPVDSRPETNVRSKKPQQAAYKDAMRGKRQGKKRAFSPARGEQSWSERPWQTKAQKTKHPNPSSIWGPDPAQRQADAQFPVQLPFSQVIPPHQREHAPFSSPETSSFRGRQLRASEQSLLEPDAALLNQGLPVPETVYDLRAYDAHISALHRGLPPDQRFLNGNGKLSPHNYGSVKRLDLGLCFATFYTNCMCEMGAKCAWRHHPLTKAEREWILNGCGEKGRIFLESLSKRWAVPDVPVPGANMHDK